MAMASLFQVPERIGFSRGDIPDESRRMLVRGSTPLIHFVKFVAHEQERLVVGQPR